MRGNEKPKSLIEHGVRQIGRALHRNFVSFGWEFRLELATSGATHIHTESTKPLLHLLLTERDYLHEDYR